MTKTALIVGATGLIGSHLLTMLLQKPEYQTVTIIVRKPLTLEHPKLKQHLIDFNQLEKIQALFKVDEVYCCLGTTIKVAKTKEAFAQVDLEYPKQIAQIANQQGVRHMFVVSSVGANTQSAVFYSRIKGEMKQAVLQSGLASIHIFRPSLLLGKRTEFRFGEAIAQQCAKWIAFFCKGRWAIYRPIEARTVAHAMIACAGRDSFGHHMYHYPQMNDLRQGSS